MTKGTALVCGAGGFIGSHLVARLKSEGYWVNCAEGSAYPANPDSDYGWEKLFSERLYLAFNRNYEMDCRIGRYHNIFGPQGTWTGGKEKSPAAICRKVEQAPEHSSIEIWGDGLQTRSFLYIDECIEATTGLKFKALIKATYTWIKDQVHTQL